MKAKKTQKVVERFWDVWYQGHVKLLTTNALIL